MKDLVNQSTILSYLIRYRFTTDTAPKIICIHIKIGNHIHRTVKAAVFLMAEHNLSIGAGNYSIFRTYNHHIVSDYFYFLFAKNCMPLAITNMINIGKRPSFSDGHTLESGNQSLVGASFSRVYK